MASEEIIIRLQGPNNSLDWAVKPDKVSFRDILVSVLFQKLAKLFLPSKSYPLKSHKQIIIGALKKNKIIKSGLL